VPLRKFHFSINSFDALRKACFSIKNKIPLK